ncbi:MAG: hypothetical protein ACI4VJ_00785 [Methanosphaera sp.]|jgi:hypothetical protein|uniref:hypothetical protein n=1 Tax=Methanosphaera TaxID=2316 RepID=UPI002380949E|nr:hypothetical protein [Candidatus Methanosphaera massiliense]MDD6285938.1 hypothetical protein [Methanobacteriaceae archaeon]MDE4077897.1 hypothetical protein [Candidatus Methanosphaera massiliense]MDY2745018.1 hypothetical protein [Methanosphaera sp.]
MKLSPLQMLVLIVILIGVAYGTYSATMDQLPDLSGTVVGNTTSVADTANQTIVGSVYIHDENNNTSNMSVVITNNTKIYKETKDNKQVECKMDNITNGCKIDVYTIGDATNTIPPQITAERIVIKNKK